ncbi:crustacyanin-C1 subunit-like [Macrobrachium rosenbergii]|uniref:crustacyanin-C1 subunit-like n=1 Tax=Macrobrachium rosenbergii TaxID=79674 RepID=UPI0034D47E99
MKLLVVALSVALVSVAADKIPDFVAEGKCPAVDEVKLWKEQIPRHSEFGGVWFQHALTKNEYQPLEKCVRIQYNFDGEGYKVSTSGVNYSGEKQERQGEIYPMPLGDPHFMVDFEGHSFAAPLVILDTDYENYACLYSCMDYSSSYFSDFAFIFSRTPELEDEYVSKCHAAFRNIGLDTIRFQKTVQGHQCDY